MLPWPKIVRVNAWPGPQQGECLTRTTNRACNAWPGRPTGRVPDPGDQQGVQCLTRATNRACNNTEEEMPDLGSRASSLPAIRQVLLDGCRGKGIRSPLTSSTEGISRGNEQPFMSKDLKKQHMKRTKLLNNNRKNRTEANHKAFKDQRNLCTKLLKKNKVTYLK